MPWSKDDYPNSMKNLKPKVREKAIEIAEAMRKENNPEGLCIATGIKKAKELHSKVKTFKKTASLNWASDAAEAQTNVLKQTQAMNNAVMAPKLSKLQQPRSFKANFASVGKITG
jgi:uncharacterized protein YdaT